MKRFYILLAALIFAVSAAAQTPAQTPEEIYIAKQEGLMKQLREAVGAKDYSTSERVNIELIRNYETMDKSLLEKYASEDVIGSMYYNLACMQALGGKREEALDSFVKACELGYDDYQKVKSDPDLDSIRDNDTFRRLYEQMRATGDYIWILQQANGYAAGGTEKLPPFTYQAPDDAELVRVREYFKLDSVVGNGGELSQIRNLLTMIHNTIRHDGQHENPAVMNSIAMAEACKDGSRGLNCRGLALVLNDCYLAMGFKSRVVTCMPKVYISDCHVINAVYSETLGKWLWVDPTNNAWVMDENGTMLSVAEVRERLRNGQPVVLNEQANWNNEESVTKEDYLDNYMAKNLYYIHCTNESRYGMEVFTKDRVRPRFIALCPAGYTPDPKVGITDYVTTDDNWFWQSPHNK